MPGCRNARSRSPRKSGATRSGSGPRTPPGAASRMATRRLTPRTAGSSPGPCVFDRAHAAACCGCRSATAGSARARSAIGVGFNASVLRTARRPGSARRRRAPAGATDSSRLRPRPVRARRRGDKACADSSDGRRHCRPPAPPAELQHAAASARRRPLRLGHGDRHRGLHRLQRLRRRLPGREQRAGRSARRRSRMGRDMHWLRIDAYELASDASRTGFQPVPCMHCETAPCEPVCPVDASVHDTKASTSRSTIAASAPGSARPTAPTRCGASTSSATPTGRNTAISAPRSCRPPTIRTSRCARAA